ncbi:MAG TPA: alpha/beta hydrolase [Vicinamibacteria bacterium]|nr:alpha/beta hydrolase [Vicinamibacteria bacterium]
MAADLVRSEWAVRAPGGPALFGQSWRPRTPRAAILIVHGLAEHSERYAATAAALADAGFAVHAVDYRGHGKSEGGRVHVDRIEDYVADVRAALQEVRCRPPAQPLFILGHSQGGLVALKLALEDPGLLDGLVVTSPFLAVHPSSRPSAFIRALAGVMLRVAPRVPMPTHIDVRVLSRDPAVGEAYARDPLVSHAVSAGWLRAIGRAQHEVRAGAPRLRVPTLLMASGDDRLVDAEAARQFARAASPGVVEFVWWDGFFHEMLNDAGREEVRARIVTWINAAIGDRLGEHRRGFRTPSG